MNRYLPLLILCAVAGLSQARAEATAEDAGRWRLTLDYQRYDGDYKAVEPYALRSGESVTTDGDITGDMQGFTLSYDRPGSHLIDGLDFSLLYGDLDGEAVYSGTFSGETDVSVDLLMLELRARHNLGDLAEDHLHPYLFLGIAHRDVQSDEVGVITFTQTQTPLPMDRTVDSKTTLLQPGIGATLDTHLGASTIGLRAEATFQIGVHEVDNSNGASADDGTAMGYRLFGGAYGDVPLSESWGLYGQAGFLYQDWLDDYDELQPYEAITVSIGIHYTF